MRRVKRLTQLAGTMLTPRVYQQLVQFTKEHETNVSEFLRELIKETLNKGKENTK